MSYDFSGSTANDITHTSLVSFGADNFVGLVTGWFYINSVPSAVDYGYWSFGNTGGCNIDSTDPTEIRLKTQNATTSGQWLTSGAGITTGKWYFIAVMFATENTTVAGDWRVWVGDGDTFPVEVTVTNPTPRSGNYTGSTALYVGNAGTSSLRGFPGKIQDVVFIGHVGGANSWLYPLSVAASGVISQSEADDVLNSFVAPLWAGQLPQLPLRNPINSSLEAVHIPLQRPNETYIVRTGHTTSLSPITQTVHGATFSSEFPPRSLPIGWPLYNPNNVALF